MNKACFGDREIRALLIN